MAGHETQALWALAAGELDAAGKARVEAHVAECAACAAEWKRVVEARTLLHTARSVEPSVRWEETGAKLKAAAAKRMAVPERRFLSPWALTLAGACAVALVVWLGGARWKDAARGAEAPVATGLGAGASGERPVDLKTRGQRGVTEGAAASGAESPSAPERVAAHSEAASTTEAERVTGAVVREATGVEHALAAGMRLRSGMAVRTPPKASAVLRLPDESRVRLSAGSDVVFARAEANAVHLTVRQGRLSVKASHARRDAFLVESAGLRVSVVGTVFSVERTAAGAAVAVLEGRVRVDAEGQPPRFVDAGERVELAGTGEAMKPRELSAGDRQAFRDLRDAEPAAAVASIVPPMQGPSRGEASPSVATRDTVSDPGTASVENHAAPSQAVAKKAPDAPTPGTPSMEDNAAHSRAVAQRTPDAPTPGASSAEHNAAHSQAFAQKSPNASAVSAPPAGNNAATSQAVAQKAPAAPTPGTPSAENDAAHSQAVAQQKTPDAPAPGTNSAESNAAPSQAVAQKMPEAPGTVVAQATPNAPAAPAMSAPGEALAQAPNTEIPQPVHPRESTPSDDFAPYPGASAGSLASSAPLPGAVQAPSVAPATPSEPRKRKTLGALVPGGLLSDDSDERFLGYAKVQTAGTTCGQFLVGLGEIATASPRTSHREQARILRGRCFNRQHLPADAEDEFRQYLREFPNGHYATEARIALGMSPEPEPGAPAKTPAPLPAPVTPRWNGSPQRAPVSPGVPRRW
ncbi:FecR domain-containing protein [Corallococcus coralloides]|uniref:FecR domain-containing protein n=1 Tax=Corallococcus coralloides TaxID=184914 RepID=UPI00384B5269